MWNLVPGRLCKLRPTDDETKLASVGVDVSVRLTPLKKQACLPCFVFGSIEVESESGKSLEVESQPAAEMNDAVPMEVPSLAGLKRRQLVINARGSKEVEKETSA